MKTARLKWAVLLFAGIACAEEFDLMDYSPKTGVVWIKTGEEETKREFDSFSPKDQQKITSSLADRDFRYALEINIEKKETRRKTDNGETADISYLIELENQSEVPLENIEMVCRTFYETSDDVGTGFYKTGTLKRKLAKVYTFSDTLQPGEKRKIKTPVISIRNEKTVNEVYDSNANEMADRSWYVGSTLYKTDRMLGMNMLLSKKDRNGKTITRETEIGQPPEKDQWRKYITNAGSGLLAP